MSTYTHGHHKSVLRSHRMRTAANSAAYLLPHLRDRDHWGRMWADRITESALARQLVDEGHATTADLRRISAAELAWAAADDGWLSVPHGEILARATPA